MAKFDATFKDLFEGHPKDWLALAGLPAADKIEFLDADLSSVTAAADKVMRVSGTRPYIAHLEFITGPDANSDFDGRALMYAALLRSRHRLPVATVALLMRLKAATPNVTGGIEERIAPDIWVSTHYRVIRVWELPVEQLLGGGIGTLPLATLAAPERELPNVVDRLSERLKSELSREEAAKVATATFIVGALRHDAAMLERLLERAFNMEDSPGYQMILERGRTREAKAMLLRVGRRLFGEPDAATVARLDAVSNPNHLEDLLERSISVSSWSELLASLERAE